jgi:replicative DNA helicase
VYLPGSGRYVPIRALVSQSDVRVASLNSESWKLETHGVTNAFCTGHKPVFRLKTALGRVIRATGNHRFLTMRGWKRLDELSHDEHIAVPRRLHGPTQPTMSDAQIGLLANSDVYWDRVVLIEPDGESDVYDLTVPGPSNFVANNIIVHNSLEQDADIVSFLYRDDMYNPNSETPNQAEVIVAKHRNGPTGVIHLFFRKELTQFVDAVKNNVNVSNY